MNPGSQLPSTKMKIMTQFSNFLSRSLTSLVGGKETHSEYKSLQEELLSLRKRADSLQEELSLLEMSRNKMFDL